VSCRLIEMRIAPGNRNFMIHRNMLLTSDGTEIVRYFGREYDLLVRTNVEVLGQSCFESCKLLEGIRFEGGSELRKIGPLRL
jgi:hypothetical protein